MDKKTIMAASCSLLIGFAIGTLIFGSNIKYKHMVEDARNKCIEYNKQYNEIFNVVTKNYISYGYEEYELAGSILQHDLPYIMAINKALYIDCRIYDESGDVVMYEQKNGERHPGEMLPDELRIIKQAY